MMYDGANSILHLLVITIILPWMFSQYWQDIKGRDFLASLMNSGDTAWGAVYTVALIVTGLFAFFVGRIADNKKLYKGLLFLFTTISVASLFLIVALLGGKINIVLIPVVALLMSFTLALFVYDASLIDVSEDANSDKDVANISGKGWSLGYIISLSLLLFLHYWSDLFRSNATYADISKILLVSAGGFALGSILIYRFWPQFSEKSNTHLKTITAEDQAASTKWFLAGAYCISEVVATLAVFVTLISKNALSMDLSQIVVQYIGFHIVAIPATWYSYVLLKKYEPYNVTVILGFAWLFVLTGGALLLRFSTPLATIVYFVITLGALMGTTPALIRALYVKFIPFDRRGVYFSWTVITQRSFAFFGPLAVTTIISLVGNAYEWAFGFMALMVSMSFFFFYKAYLVK